MLLFTRALTKISRSLDGVIGRRETLRKISTGVLAKIHGRFPQRLDTPFCVSKEPKQEPYDWFVLNNGRTLLLLKRRKEDEGNYPCSGLSFHAHRLWVGQWWPQQTKCPRQQSSPFGSLRSLNKEACSSLEIFAASFLLRFGTERPGWLSSRLCLSCVKP